MKLFSKSMAVALFLGGATLLQVAGVLSCHRNLQKPGDLELRYNESLCAHRGINPFKIWNRELRHNDFRGLVRPDRQNDNDKNKRMVHAYPPWHTVYTWFYGDLPWSFVVAIMYFMCGISVATLCCRLMTMQPNSYCTFYWSWNLLFIFPAMVSCLVWGNYGIVCAGLLLIIAKLFRTSHQIALGVAWGIMMIKPQIATLLIFPLLFTKKILAVFTAIVICAFSTLFLAYIYSESPISLIMQIPQIGAPYDTSVFFRKLLPSSCVPVVKFTWIVTCVLLCGTLSWKWRLAKNPVFCFAPVAFIFPLWLYSQTHDMIAAWPFISLMACVLPQLLNQVSRIGRNVVRAYVLSTVCSAIFSGVWSCLCAFGIINSLGIGWMYHAVNFPVAAMHFFIGIYILSRGPILVDYIRKKSANAKS